MDRFVDNNTLEGGPKYRTVLGGDYLSVDHSCHIRRVQDFSEIIEVIPIHA